MLTMRNGLSLHPGYSLGSLQSMLAPSAGLDLDEGNPLLHGNRATEAPSRDQDVFMQTPLAPATNHGPSSLPTLVPSTPNPTNPAMLPSYAPPLQQNRYGLLNHMASTKVLATARLFWVSQSPITLANTRCTNLCRIFVGTTRCPGCSSI